MKTAQPGRREELLDAIAREERRVARLESEQADARSRLAALRAELASFGAEPELRERLAVVAEVTVPNTSAEKVKLFRSLFRGREEVFPTRFGRLRLVAIFTRISTAVHTSQALQRLARGSGQLDVGPARLRVGFQPGFGSSVRRPAVAGPGRGMNFRVRPAGVANYRAAMPAARAACRSFASRV